MAYADYAFYIYNFYGESIPETDFPRVAQRASGYIDKYTLGKARLYDDKYDEIKKACCAVAEVLYQYENGGELSSQTVGSWSRSYVTSGESKDQKIYKAISLYLEYTGLLYRGLRYV